MGSYTFDARKMEFTGNEYDHNVSYGLDPHDDSDYLTIRKNHFHHNGNHGLICSQRCDHLVIADNESDHNGLGSQAPTHGIMVHRGVTDTVIENNNVHDNVNGAGIAVFDSSGVVIRGNTVTRNQVGLRYSVGSTNITAVKNTVTNSGNYALWTFKGSDPAVYGVKSGRPTHLTFTGNTFAGAGSNLVLITDSEDIVFTGNTYRGKAGPVSMVNSKDVHFKDRSMKSE
jgi:mannuronan 5-epimerase